MNDNVGTPSVSASNTLPTPGLGSLDLAELASELHATIAACATTTDERLVEYCVELHREIRRRGYNVALSGGQWHLYRSNLVLMDYWHRERHSEGDEPGVVYVAHRTVSKTPRKVMWECFFHLVRAEARAQLEGDAGLARWYRAGQATLLQVWHVRAVHRKEEWLEFAPRAAGHEETCTHDL